MMRLAALFWICVSLATTSLCNGKEFSQVRDLPALKMGATDLDAILLKIHSLIDAANGSEDSGREMVKVSIDGQDIEIPHLSLASSVAFPNEVFGFSYTYHQADKSISSVTFSCALSPLSLEFHCRIFFYEIGGSDFVHISGPRRSGFEDL